MKNNQTESPDQSSDFLRAADQERMGLAAEFWDFLKHNKKWWLLPIVLFMGLIAVLLLLTSTAAAPFIYPLF